MVLNAEYLKSTLHLAVLVQMKVCTTSISQWTTRAIRQTIPLRWNHMLLNLGLARRWTNRPSDDNLLSREPDAGLLLRIDVIFLVQVTRCEAMHPALMHGQRTHGSTGKIRSDQISSMAFSYLLLLREKFTLTAVFQYSVNRIFS